MGVTTQLPETQQPAQRPSMVAPQKITYSDMFLDM